MSVAIISRRVGWKTAVTWGGLALGLALLLADLLMHDTLFHGTPLEASASSSRAEAGPAAGDGPPPGASTTVTLPEGKWKAAGIATEPPRRMKLAAELGVPGQIEVNPDTRVEVRPRANGIIREVRALLGQQVKRGDTLAVLDSPDVGAARLALHSRQRELVTMRADAAWKGEVAANVARLIPELRAGTPASKIEQEYAKRPLGSDRALLLQSYAEYEIASHEEEKTSGLYKQKILGEHPAFLALHTREGARAKFEATLEQVPYDANRQKLVADQQVRNAEAAVIEAAQRLRILGVDADVDALLAHPEKALDGSVDADVAGYTIVAQIDGTIITKDAPPGQKAEMNDILFTIADLSTVWVRANVYESDFAYLQALRGGTIQLTATAYPGRTFEAKVLSIGAVVDPATRTVPILAETPNPDDMLKLGMFVRIVLDSATTEDLLTVPVAAVVEIDGQKGVFLPAEPKGKDKDKQGHAYTFHPVKLGRESGGRQVVLAGVAEGKPVVSAGAFFLKAELILQNEPEED